MKECGGVFDEYMRPYSNIDMCSELECGGVFDVLPIFCQRKALPRFASVHNCLNWTED